MTRSQQRAEVAAVVGARRKMATTAAAVAGAMGVEVATADQLVMAFGAQARARAVALTISNTAVDTSWKLGTFRLDIHAGGRR